MAKAPRSAERVSLTPKQEAEQARILRDQNADGAYLFALEIPGADIAALQKVVLSQGDAWSAYVFAMAVPGADILTCALQMARLDLPNKEWRLDDLRRAHPEVLTPEVMAELSLGVTL